MAAMTDNIHVVPENDTVEHDDDDDCVCGPQQKCVERDDGSMGWVVVHHSLDGRELDEVALAAGCVVCGLVAPKAPHVVEVHEDGRRLAFCMGHDPRKETKAQRFERLERERLATRPDPIECTRCRMYWRKTQHPSGVCVACRAQGRR